MSECHVVRFRSRVGVLDDVAELIVAHTLHDRVRARVYDQPRAAQMVGEDAVGHPALDHVVRHGGLAGVDKTRHDIAGTIQLRHGLELLVLVQEPLHQRTADLLADAAVLAVDEILELRATRERDRQQLVRKLGKSGTISLPHPVKDTVSASLEDRPLGLRACHAYDLYRWCVRRLFEVHRGVRESVSRPPRWGDGGDRAAGIVGVQHLPPIGQGLGGHAACRVISAAHRAGKRQASNAATSLNLHGAARRAYRVPEA